VLAELVQRYSASRGRVRCPMIAALHESCPEGNSGSF
jgi:hypothetical protein